MVTHVQTFEWKNEVFWANIHRLITTLKFLYQKFFFLLSLSLFFFPAQKAHKTESESRKIDENKEALKKLEDGLVLSRFSNIGLDNDGHTLSLVSTCYTENS